MKGKHPFLLLLVFLMVLIGSCRKDIPAGKFASGQVALTFDDYNIDNWYSNLPLLDSLGIKATFYVCRYHMLSQKQKDKLKSIASHGHEIGYHTSRHGNLVKEYEKKGLAWVMQDEIKTDLELMQKDGYVIHSFAYPYGSHNTALDAALIRDFKSVRALSNKQNWYESLVKQSGEKQVLHGAGIDEPAKISDETILDLLTNARDYHDCVVLTAHEINHPEYSLQISARRLKMLASKADQLGLKFITVHEICQ